MQYTVIPPDPSQNLQPHNESDIPLIQLPVQFCLPQSLFLGVVEGLSCELLCVAFDLFNKKLDLINLSSPYCCKQESTVEVGEEGEGVRTCSLNGNFSGSAFGFWMTVIGAWEASV